MPFKLNFNVFFLFIAFFIISYLEDIYIASISFASIWKTPFILYGIYYTYLAPKDKFERVSFINIGGLFCLLMLFHSNMGNSVMPEITDALKYIIIPTLFFYLINEYKNRPIQIIKILFWLSVFLIWTNIPYMLKIIEPKVQKDYSVAFGDDMLDSAGFSGPYMTIHSQAVYMASACLFLIFLIIKYPKKFSYKNWFLIITLLIGLYCLYLSYARTGWLYFVIGISIIFFDNFQWKRLRKTLPLILLFSISLLYLYNEDSSFRKRLLDERQYSSGDSNYDLGSGRLIITETAFQNWWASDSFTILKGYGMDKGKDLMQQRLGKRIFAHNGYMEILQVSGIIGLFVFILFIVKIFKFIRRRKNSFSRLAMAYFIGWLTVGAVQTFTFVYFNFFIGAILAVSFLTEKHSNISKEK